MFEAWRDGKIQPVLSSEAYQPFPKRTDRTAWIELKDRDKILEWGETVRRTEWPVLLASSFMDFVRTGNRIIWEKPYFERRKRLIGALLAECITNDGKYLDSIVDGIWLVCEESSWVISAHNGSDHDGQRAKEMRLLPDVDNPYIDLFAAQTAQILAFALYFLGDLLDKVSPLISRRIRVELERRIIHPFLTRDDYWWMGFIRKDLCNWTPWIVSNIMSVMMLLPIEPDRLSWGLERAGLMLDRWLACVPDDGGCSEGVGYWNMAGGCLIDCLERFDLATDGKINLWNEQKIKNIAAFPLKAHIGNDWFWNFADCDAKPKLDGERLLTFGLKTDNPEMQHFGAALMSKQYPLIADTPQMDRLLNRLFHLATDIGQEKYKQKDTIILPDLQVWAWRRNGIYAAIKGGNNGESHNHNDVGSFIIYADNEPCVIDVGNMVYTAKTFGAERYELFNTRSWNHNLPVIGGEEQQPGKEYAAIPLKTGHNSIVLDLSKAWPDGLLISYMRGFQMSEDGTCILHDTIQTNEPKNVQWIFMLREKPQISSKKVKTGKVVIEFDETMHAEVKEIPVTDARMANNFPGCIWRLMICDSPAAIHEHHFIFKRGSLI